MLGEFGEGEGAGNGSFVSGSCPYIKEKKLPIWGFSQTLIFFQIDFLLGIWGKANIVQLGHMKKRAQISKIKKYLKILLKH